MQVNGAVPRARAAQERARAHRRNPAPAFGASARRRGAAATCGEWRRAAGGGAVSPAPGAKWPQASRAESAAATRAAPARGASRQARGGVARACSRPPAFEWWAPPPPHTYPHLPGRAVPLAQPPTKRPTPGRMRGGGVRGLEGRERARQASRAARPDCAGGLRECAGGRLQLVAAARRWGCSFKWSTMRQRQQRPQRPAVALLPRPRLVLPIGGPIAGAALLARSAR